MFHKLQLGPAVHIYWNEPRFEQLQRPASAAPLMGCKNVSMWHFYLNLISAEKLNGSEHICQQLVNYQQQQCMARPRLLYTATSGREKLLSHTGRYGPGWGYAASHSVTSRGVPFNRSFVCNRVYCWNIIRRCGIRTPSLTFSEVSWPLLSRVISSGSQS